MSIGQGAPDRSRESDSTWVLAWAVFYAVVIIGAAIVVLQRSPDAAYALAMLGLPVSFVSFLVLQAYLVGERKNLGYVVSTWLHDRQLTWLPVATPSVLGCLCFWLTMTVWRDELAGILAGGMTIVAAVAFNCAFVLSMEERVKKEQPDPRIDPLQFQGFVESVRSAWPTDQFGVRQAPAAEDALREGIVARLAKESYPVAGTMLKRLLDDPDPATISAANALWEYVEARPSHRRLFDVVRGYADGSLYAQEDLDSETLDCYKRRLLGVWPGGQQDVQREEEKAAYSEAREKLVTDLTSLPYLQAGRLLRTLLEDSDAQTAGAAYALLDYMEQRPDAAALFSGLRAYAQGASYGAATPRAISAWILDSPVLPRLKREGVWGTTDLERPIERAIKRILDIVISAVLLVFFTLIVPAFPVIAFLLRLENSELPLPILMKSLRIGRMGVPFNYLRFRTRITRDSHGTPVPGRVSRILILTGLDKSPALVNVLLGHMSMVGPHPLHWRRYHLLLRLGISPEQWLPRLRVKPGLTGPSQLVSLLPTSGYRCEDYLRKDAAYAQHWTVPKDMLILTLHAVLLLLTLWRIPASFVRPGNIFPARASADLRLASR